MHTHNDSNLFIPEVIFRAIIADEASITRDGNEERERKSLKTIIIIIIFKYIARSLALKLLPRYCRTHNGLGHVARYFYNAEQFFFLLSMLLGL